jgi:hypothetical protein
MVQRAYHDQQKDVPVTPANQEILRILEALCQELGAQTKYVFLIMSHIPLMLILVQ